MLRLKFGLFLILALLFSKCKVEKRLYTKGYHLEWVKPIHKNTTIKYTPRHKPVVPIKINTPNFVNTYLPRPNIKQQKEVGSLPKVNSPKPIGRTDNISRQKIKSQKKIADEPAPEKTHNSNVSSALAVFFGLVFPILVSVFSIGGGFFTVPLLIALAGFYLMGYFIAIHSLKKHNAKGKFNQFSFPNVVYQIFQVVNYSIFFFSFFFFSGFYWFSSIYYSLVQIIPLFILVVANSFLPFLGKKYVDDEPFRKFKELTKSEKFTWLWSAANFLMLIGFVFIPPRLFSQVQVVELFIGLAAIFLFAGSFFIQKLFEDKMLENKKVSAHLKTTKNAFQIGLLLLSLWLMLFGVDTLLFYLRNSSALYGYSMWSFISALIFSLTTLIFEIKWFFRTKALTNT